MSNDVLAVALKKYEEWEAKLMASHAYINLKAWEQVILVNGGELPKAKPKVTVTANTKKRAKTPATPAKPAGVETYPDGMGKLDYIKKLSAEYIRDHEGRAKIGPMNEYVLSKGVKVTKSRHSAYLSEDKETFLAAGKGVSGEGWGLK